MVVPGMPPPLSDERRCLLARYAAGATVAAMATERGGSVAELAGRLDEALREVFAHLGRLATYAEEFR